MSEIKVGDVYYVENLPHSYFAAWARGKHIVVTRVSVTCDYVLQGHPTLAARHVADFPGRIRAGMCRKVEAPTVEVNPAAVNPEPERAPRKDDEHARMMRFFFGVSPKP